MTTAATPSSPTFALGLAGCPDAEPPTMGMPRRTLDVEVRPGWLERVRGIVGEQAVKSRPDELLVYECDAFTIARNRPAAVVFPKSTAEVAAVVATLADHNVPIIPRGAGTSLAGGTFAPSPGVVVSTTRLNGILEINLRDRYAVVEAGLVNANLSREIAASGWHYAPDPSSQGACTIGGNVCTNSGGPHTLKYGVTVNHTLGGTWVLADGSILRTGGPVEDTPGYNLTGLLVGSEGTLAINTEATVRLTRLPAAYRTLLAVFESPDAATNAVADIIGAGILPAALEMIDAMIIKALEEAFHFGFPLDAGAVLIIELDGLEAGLDAAASRARELCLCQAAREVRLAGSVEERTLLWKCRKRAFGALGRLSPSYCTQDGVIPRTKLPEMLRTVRAVSQRYGLAIANVFHAGDGNLHPVILFDERDPQQVTKALAASDEILRACVTAGGSITGEHGVGIEKIAHLPLLFSPDDLAVFTALRRVFNPANRLNPDKLFAYGTGCMEVPKLRLPGRRAAM